GEKNRIEPVRQTSAGQLAKRISPVVSPSHDTNRRSSKKVMAEKNRIEPVRQTSAGQLAKRISPVVSPSRNTSTRSARKVTVEKNRIEPVRRSSSRQSSAHTIRPAPGIASSQTPDRASTKRQRSTAPIHSSSRTRTGQVAARTPKVVTPPARARVSGGNNSAPRVQRPVATAPRQQNSQQKSSARKSSPKPGKSKHRDRK
ncbi:MAG: hypothetical protein OQJ84_05240, partial [Xanthomonadales bacterium]|nr:hypothetical protein [Xanthomonadales bacterium]